jgi:hypothetical protein
VRVVVLETLLEAVDAFEQGFEDVGLRAALFRDGVCFYLLACCVVGL